MATQVDDKKVFSLLEVTNSIRKTISERYQRSFWVRAEMNKLNYYSYSGHCYPELVEKNNGRVVAQMRASFWRDDYQRSNEKFVQLLGEPLKDGIFILFEASIAFDPVHGMSLRIIDIDPVFSLGALERERVESLARLKAQGVYDLNRQIPFPLVPKRIAIISVETSKGYADFLKVIEGNSWGYRFSFMLFPALLQGDRSVDSIVNQLQRVRRVAHHFDVVTIIRGGGGDVGLASYNNYRLAYEVARFPLPVLTGIGHSTNETVTEMVAHKNAITPTALAEFLLQRMHDFAEPVNRAAGILADRSRRLLLDEARFFDQMVRGFRAQTYNVLARRSRDLQVLVRGMSQGASFALRRQHEQSERSADRLRRSLSVHLQRQQLILSALEKAVGVMDPVHVLRRGFSITTVAGKAIKSAEGVQEGQSITTQLADGQLTSTVTGKTKQL